MSTKTILINTRDDSITKDEMIKLYQNNLIGTDDITLFLGNVPIWAVQEVKELIGLDLTNRIESALECGYELNNKKQVEQWNQYHYPELYDMCMDDENMVQSYE